MQAISSVGGISPPGTPPIGLPVTMAPARPSADRAAEPLEEAFWQGLLAAASEPTVLVDGEARIVAMTEPARALLRGGDTMTIVEDRLRGIAAATNDRLRRLIGDATGASAAPGSIRVRYPSPRPALIVSAFPIPHARRAAVMVRIVDPIARREGAAPRWAQAFGFTPRESDLAVLLMAGHSAESAAAAMAIGLPTIRLHLRHLLAKTETSRQSDLIRLLARI